jgi:hypothetical protein
LARHRYNGDAIGSFAGLVWVVQRLDHLSGMLLLVVENGYWGLAVGTVHWGQRESFMKSE